ncbi:MAG: hypothetical protein MRK01_01940 [Candidatus Scalindua sp.]|nr:hypothetical protein [Candidatus Scalindua sp.]
MAEKRDGNNKSRYRIAVSDPELDNKTARVIYDRWPGFVTQREIAHDLNVSPSLVSKRLSRWRSKENIPLKMFYDERNIELEKRLRDTYNLKDRVVLKNTDYFVHRDSYSNQLGKYASHIHSERDKCKAPGCR